MDRELGKEKSKASESAPMPTKGRKNAKYRNQTTQVPKSRFPWMTILTVLFFIILVVVVISFLEIGSS